MYYIDMTKNEIQKIDKKTFTELKFRERKHLQEWISKNPSILLEELLIIQKEFDGFDNTKERLDLLAIDIQGNLVVVENKITDRDKNQTWQSLKYVSYCAGLGKEEIVEIYQQYINKQGLKENAEDNICEFLNIPDFDDVELNKNKQRIILVADNFRKEVTSTVLWLRDNGIDIKCIRINPHKLGEKIILDTDQLIPFKDADDYMIKISNKKRKELEDSEKVTKRKELYLEYWTKILKELNERTSKFSGVSPSTNHYIALSSGHSGVSYVIATTSKYANVGINILYKTKEETKEAYDKIYSQRKGIETKLGFKLEWVRNDEQKSSKAILTLNNVDINNKNQWNNLSEFLIENLLKIEESMREVLNGTLK